MIDPRDRLEPAWTKQAFPCTLKFATEKLSGLILMQRWQERSWTKAESLIWALFPLLLKSCVIFRKFWTPPATVPCGHIVGSVWIGRTGNHLVQYLVYNRGYKLQSALPSSSLRAFTVNLILLIYFLTFTIIFWDSQKQVLYLRLLGGGIGENSFAYLVLFRFWLKTHAFSLLGFTLF